jgi:hypothetical protein
VLVVDGKLLRAYQGGDSQVEAEAGAHWRGLVDCCQWLVVGVRPGCPGPVLVL